MKCNAVGTIPHFTDLLGIGMIVSPAKAGVERKNLDSGFRRND